MLIKNIFFHFLHLVLILIFTIDSLHSQNVPTIRIDPSQAYGGTVSDYFSDVEYIPLETKTESLFGYIHKLIITDSSYVIIDKDTRAVYFFSTKGKFLKKVAKNDNKIPVQVFKNEALDAVLIAFASDMKYSVLKYSLTVNNKNQFL